MKKIFAILAVFTLLFLTSCKKADTNTSTAAEAITIIPQSAVPTVVVTAFTATFSGASELEWHKSGSLFHVEFNHNNQRHSASFDDSGHENEEHITCLTGAVPAVVLAAFRIRNANDSVYEWKLTSDSNWKAHFNRIGVKWETTFSATGTFIAEERA